MKRLGMVGGIGPESTIDYYRMLIRGYRERFGGPPSGEPPEGSAERFPNRGAGFPELFIASIDMQKMCGMVEKKRYDELSGYLLDALNALERAGADFGIIASNTPHLVFERVRSASPLPLISIVEETCKKARELGLRRCALLGTGFTMRSTYYQDVFDRERIGLVVPSEEEIDYIHRRIMEELEQGVVASETRRNILGIVDRLKKEKKVQGVILGCTELPLMFPNDELGLPFLNTSAIHVAGALRYMEEERE